MQRAIVAQKRFCYIKRVMEFAQSRRCFFFSVLQRVALSEFPFIRSRVRTVGTIMFVFDRFDYKIIVKKKKNDRVY